MPIFKFDTRQVKLWTDDQMDPDKVLDNLIKDEIRDSEKAKMCKLTGKQRQEMYTSMMKLVVTVMKVVLFNIIVSSIIPEDKYYLDRGFRRQLPYFINDNQVNDTFKKWNVLIKAQALITFKT